MKIASRQWRMYSSESNQLYSCHPKLQECSEKCQNTTSSRCGLRDLLVVKIMVKLEKLNVSNNQRPIDTSLIRSNNVKMKPCQDINENLHKLINTCSETQRRPGSFKSVIIERCTRHMKPEKGTIEKIGWLMKYKCSWKKEEIWKIQIDKSTRSAERHKT